MIEIIITEKADATLPGEAVREIWACWLQLTQGPDTWLLPATAPGTLAAGELQAHFDAREADLWRVAQAKQYPVDVWERIPLKRLLRAFALVMLDEVNLLRDRAGMPQRTADQIVGAIKAKLR